MHKKVREIAAQEGVPLSKALEILVSTLATDSIPSSRDLQDSKGVETVGDPLDFLFSPVDRSPADISEKPITDHTEKILNSFQDGLNERVEMALNKAFRDRDDPLVEYFCHTCHVLIDEAENAICERCGEEKRKQGVSEAHDYYRSIPGVVAALEFHEEQEDRNKEHPAIPVVTDWSLVPGVKELLENYQADNSVISIAESPSEYIEAEAATQDGMRPVRLKVSCQGKQVPVPAEGYTQLVRIKQGSMAGKQLYLRPQDVHNS